MINQIKISDEPKVKLHALDHQTDTLIGTLDNQGERLFWDDLYIRDLNGEHSFSFTMPSGIKEAEAYKMRARIVTPREEGGYEEFIVHLAETIGKEKEIRSKASYADLDKRFTMNAGEYTGTLKELMELGLNELHPKDYRPRIVEYSGIRTITLDKPIGLYTYLSRLMTLFEVEMDFFLEAEGNTVIARHVDAVKRIGQNRGKMIEIGRDLMSVERKENSDRVVTQLRCLGPEREDGTRLEVFVSDEDAFQRWNYLGSHLTEVYEPDSEDLGMTLEQLEIYGRKELNKRIASIVEYSITAADIGTKTFFGDDVRIKDPKFAPPLYADARAIRIEKSYTLPFARRFRIGEVVTYNEDDLYELVRSIRKAYNTKLNALQASKTAIFKQATKPSLENRVDGDAWFDEANGNMLSVFSETEGDFIATKLDYQALAVATLSAITANLGTVTAGHLIGVLIEAATFTSSGTSPYGEQMELLLSSGVIRISTNEKGVRIDSNTIRIRDFIGLSGEHDRFYARLEDTTGKMILGSTTFNPDPGSPPFPGGPVEFDLEPNFNFEVKIKNGLRHEGGQILSNQADTGYVAVGTVAPDNRTSQIASGYVNFRMRKTYIPSSIDFDPLSTTAPIEFIDVTEEGFGVYVNGSGTAFDLRYWRGHWEA